MRRGLQFALYLPYTRSLESLIVFLQRHTFRLSYFKTLSVGPALAGFEQVSSRSADRTGANPNWAAVDQ